MRPGEHAGPRGDPAAISREKLLELLRREDECAEALRRGEISTIEWFLRVDPIRQIVMPWLDDDHPPPGAGDIPALLTWFKDEHPFSLLEPPSGQTPPEPPES